MQHAPVVYGTPTESWTGFDSPPVHYPWELEDFSLWFFGFVLVPFVGISRAARKSWDAKFKGNLYVGTGERFQRASSKARQGEARKERTRTNVYGYSWVGLGWGKKDRIAGRGGAAANRVECGCSEGGVGGGVSARNPPASPLQPQTQTQTPTTTGSAGTASPGAPLRGRGRRWGEVLGEEDARVVDLRLFLLLVLSGGELRRHELDLVALGLPAQLSQLDVQLPRARAYERRDGDAAASPRPTYPGARGVAGVVVGGVIRIRTRQRLAAPMHHPYRALRERVRILVYALPIERGVRDERREECERELVAEKEEAVGEGGACEASDEQGHSDESGEGGGEKGAQVNASGAEVEARSYCAARGRPEQRRVDPGRGLDRSGGGTWKGARRAAAAAR
ncbi:hypothetical protein B0H14DRAFT_3166273 [Mycena olivaceomarginata]|nr:hypothetical protein B0H14DRAFT_3166273 [Mycena olivaceomarginata]